MEKQGFLPIMALLVLAVIIESAVLPPSTDNRVLKNEGIPRRIPALGKDKKPEPSPGIGIPGRGSYDSSGIEYDDSGTNNSPGQPPDYDYNRPDETDENKPGIRPEIVPEYGDGNINKVDGSSSDEDNFEPFDGGEDSGQAEGDEEMKPPTDEDEEEVPKGSTDDENVKSEEDADKDKEPDEEGDKDKEPDEEGEEKLGDENDESGREPDNDDNHDEKDSGHFLGGSIFDTPFFNLDKVKKYFNQMERALGQVFHQVLDEARLLNGTYANTTEEEVDIGGKKYIVQKSVIKGADNNSTLYVEALSTKPKLGIKKGIKGVEMKKKAKE